MPNPLTSRISLANLVLAPYSRHSIQKSPLLSSTALSRSWKFSYMARCSDEGWLGYLGQPMRRLPWFFMGCEKLCELAIFGGTGNVMIASCTKIAWITQKVTIYRNGSFFATKSSFLKGKWQRFFDPYPMLAMKTGGWNPRQKQPTVATK